MYALTLNEWNIVIVKCDQLRHIILYSTVLYCTHFLRNITIGTRMPSFSFVAHQPIFFNCLCGWHSFGTLQHLLHRYLSLLQKDKCLWKQFILRWKYPQLFCHPGYHLPFINLGLTTSIFDKQIIGWYPHIFSKLCSTILTSSHSTMKEA